MRLNRNVLIGYLVNIVSGIGDTNWMSGKVCQSLQINLQNIYIGICFYLVPIVPFVMNSKEIFKTTLKERIR